MLCRTYGHAERSGRTGAVKNGYGQGRKPGFSARPVWGPEAHGGSNWNKPGQEWGAGYVFTSPGCWDLHADRGSAYADVWIRVVKH